MHWAEIRLILAVSLILVVRPGNQEEYAWNISWTKCLERPSKSVLALSCLPCPAILSWTLMQTFKRKALRLMYLPFDKAWA